MTKPICTKENPAPKGESIYPGARMAHIARPDWDHPDFSVSAMVTSGGTFPDRDLSRNAFQPEEYRQCKHCGGNMTMTKRHVSAFLIGDSITTNGHHYVVRYDNNNKPNYFEIDGIAVSELEYRVMRGGQFP